MSHNRARLWTVFLCLGLILSACGENSIFKPNPDAPQKVQEEKKGTSLFDLLKPQDDPNVTLRVNKYLWNATFEVLNFLPIQSADPFSGVIVTGYGTPPGGHTAYRATILIQDPALDARSLNIALMTRSGPVSPDTVRAVEDAILTRARQLKIADKDL